MGSASPNTTHRNLSTLLSHLDSTLALLLSQASAALASSHPASDAYLLSLERQKLRSNFEYARQLLLGLEHESTSIKVASRKQAVQHDLRTKRDTVKRMQGRMSELDGVVQQLADLEDEEPVEEENVPEPEVHQSSTQYDHNYNGTTSEGIRRRGGTNHDRDNSAYASGAYHSSTNHKTDGQDEATRDAQLTTARAEQDAIMSSLLSLTSQLKASAATFNTSIENEKGILEKASQGLDRNVDGLDAAGKRMGTLRKMTEGKGWFARLKLYGMIGALWLVALVLVFVMPKLRF